MKIENISFNVEACSEMSFKEFKKSFGHLITRRKFTLEEVYYQVTGRQPEQEGREIKIDDPTETQDDTFSKKKSKKDKFKSPSE